MLVLPLDIQISGEEVYTHIAPQCQDLC